MKRVWQILSKKSLTTIFAFAPAGLGHLRVTDALYHGLPINDNVILLGTQDRLDKFFHNFVSKYPFMKKMGEWTQYGVPEAIITKLYIALIRNNTYLLSRQLDTILDQRFDPAERVLIVATHFSLAHQLAVAKQQVEKKRQIKIWLIVQVTDDSPQQIWYVEGADLICVPSEFTKNKLQQLVPKDNKLKPTFVVLPYPLSPLLSSSLRRSNLIKRKRQLRPDRVSQIHISLPVSGAAAGFEKNLAIAEKLHSVENRVFFHVVSRSNSYTLPLLSKLLEKSYIQVYMSPKDRQVVELYEKLYEDHVISLEITKPSEQAFKVLLTPTQVGGAILLFSESYGRQEYDNVSFLLRHRLIPSKQVQKKLWELSKKNQVPDSELLKDITSWRGLCLPAKEKDAAEFIVWCLKQNIFYQMISYKEIVNAEVASNGVEQFWGKVAEVIESKEVKE